MRSPGARGHLMFSGVVVVVRAARKSLFLIAKHQHEECL